MCKLLDGANATARLDLLLQKRVDKFNCTAFIIITLSSPPPPPLCRYYQRARAAILYSFPTCTRLPIICVYLLPPPRLYIYNNIIIIIKRFNLVAIVKVFTAVANILSHHYFIVAITYYYCYNIL